MVYPGARTYAQVARLGASDGQAWYVMPMTTYDRTLDAQPPRYEISGTSVMNRLTGFVGVGKAMAEPWLQ